MKMPKMSDVTIFAKCPERTSSPQNILDDVYVPNRNKNALKPSKMGQHMHTIEPCEGRSSVISHSNTEQASSHFGYNVLPPCVNYENTDLPYLGMSVKGQLGSDHGKSSVVSTLTLWVDRLNAAIAKQ